MRISKQLKELWQWYSNEKKALNRSSFMYSDYNIKKSDELFREYDRRLQPLREEVERLKSESARAEKEKIQQVKQKLKQAETPEATRGDRP